MGQQRFPFCSLAILGAALASAWGQEPVASPSTGPVRLPTDLAAGFHSPPHSAKPWVYWWWIHGNVTPASITRDLEEMKAKGIGGLLLFDARGYHDDYVPPPASRAPFLGEEWRGLFKHALAEAARLGLHVSVNLSSCAGALKGPWPVGDDAPKTLVWARRDVQGPQRLVGELPRGDWKRGWNIAVMAVRHNTPDDKGDPPVVTEVVDLTASARPDGELDWEVPEGRWSLLRFAYALMPGREEDVDILDPNAVDGHFDRMGKLLLGDAGLLAGKTLTHFYSVSWEGATPTWTAAFEQEFRTRRGYAIRPWLPALAGLAVRSRELSARFLRDYHRTLADCFMDNCYGRLRERSRQTGLQWHSESGGPWNRKLPSFEHADQLAFLGRNDMPQGEFWHRGRAMNRPAAMAAHIYGRPLAATEAFTHMRAHWSAYPAALKKDADEAFCDGSNLFIWHTFTASPPEFGKPGLEYFAGTHLNPNVTWWRHAGAFLAYLARCQFLLQQGHAVCDVCCYTGDRPYLDWGRGEAWSPSATLSPPRGHAYDLINTEVLLERLRAENGRLVLPDGMTYAALVVDLADEAAPPSVLRKIAELAEAKATVMLGRRRPMQAPGLRDHPACDEQVRGLADVLWGAAPRRSRAVVETTVDAALRERAILPDFEGPWRFIHRRTEAADIYFLSGSGQAECTFRVSGREPELWDPVTGSVRDAVCWRRTDDGRTAVPVALPESGAVFVVFQRPAEARHLVSVSSAPQALEVVGRTADGARLRGWQAGRYAVTSLPGGQQAAVVAALPEQLTLNGPWQVRFERGGGAPGSAVFDALLPWNEHADEGIRYFSGTAVYQTAFDLTEDRARHLVRLRLGRVGHVARVWVNGAPLGMVWTDPWTVDATGAIRAGKNELAIEVTNLWANRLIRDSGLPASERITRTIVPFLPPHSKLPPYRGYAPTDSLVPSGLMGPVTLEFGVEMDLLF